MKVRSQTVVETLLKLVEHRDERIRHAALTPGASVEAERSYASKILEEKLYEFVEVALPELEITPRRRAARDPAEGSG